MAGATLLYVIFFLACYYWMRYGTPIPNPPKEMVISVAKNFCPIFILVIANYLIVYHFTLSVPRWTKFIIDFLCSVGVLVSINLFITFTSHSSVEWAGTLFSDIIIFIAIENLHSEKISKIALRQQALIRHELMRYKYESLKNQFDPHFLFNSLNILYSFIHIDPKMSQQYVLKLSQIYRYILNQYDKNEITLKEELNFLDSYIEILKLRYKDSLNIKINNITPYYECKIISLSLQILIENVVKHNKISSANPMIIHINGHDNYLEVSNPIIPKIQTTESGIGLNNLKVLYKGYEREFRVEKDEKNFKVFLPYL